MKVTSRLEPSPARSPLLTYYQMIERDGLYIVSDCPDIVYVIKEGYTLRSQDNKLEGWKAIQFPLTISPNFSQFERLPDFYKFSLTFEQTT